MREHAAFSLLQRQLPALQQGDATSGSVQVCHLLAANLAPFARSAAFEKTLALPLLAAVEDAKKAFPPPYERSTVTLRSIALGSFHAVALLHAHPPARQRRRNANFVGQSFVVAWGWRDKSQTGGTCSTAARVHARLFGGPAEAAARVVILHRSLDVSFAIAEVQAGDDFSIARTHSGLLFAWGSNEFGECGVGPKYRTVRTPTLVDRLEPTAVSQFACGAKHAAAVARGQVFVWGHQAYVGCTTEPENVNLYVPVRVIAFESAKDFAWKHVAVGLGFCVAVHSSGKRLMSWGRNDAGQLGLGPGPPRFVPVPTVFELPEKMRVRQICVAKDFVVATVAEDLGMLLLWGAFRSTGAQDLLSLMAPRKVRHPEFWRGLTVKSIAVADRSRVAILLESADREEQTHQLQLQGFKRVTRDQDPLVPDLFSFREQPRGAEEIFCAWNSGGSRVDYVVANQRLYTQRDYVRRRRLS